MLFYVGHRYKDGFTHDDQKKMLEMWASFEPPPGLEIKMHTFSPAHP